MSVSYLKVICARSLGHIEAFGDLRSKLTATLFLIHNQKDHPVLRLAPVSLISVIRSTDTQQNNDCNLKRLSGARKGESQRIGARAAISSKWVQSRIIDRCRDKV